MGAGPRQTPAIPSSRANQRRRPVRIHRAKRQVSPNDRQRRSLHAAARTIKPPTRSPQSATIPASPTCTGSQPYTTRSSSAEAPSKSKHPYFQNKPMPAKPAAHTNTCESRQSSKQETIASPNSQESKPNVLPPNRSAVINSIATPLVPDEWLMENTRAMHKAQVTDNLVWDGFALGRDRRTCQERRSPVPRAAPTCAFIVLGQSINPQEADARSLVVWRGKGLGARLQDGNVEDSCEIEEWFVDPRRSPQVWPSPVTGPTEA